MTARILVAGIGNRSFGDDGFGVEVARRLSEMSWPPSVTIRDVGIRGLHLASDLASGWDLLVVVDAMSRGCAPGTLYVIEPQVTPPLTRAQDAHGVDLEAALAACRALGAHLPAVVVVGCDVGEAAEGIGLTDAVEAAVPRAARMVKHLVHARLSVSAGAESSDAESPDTQNGRKAERPAS